MENLRIGLLQIYESHSGTVRKPRGQNFGQIWAPPPLPHICLRGMYTVSRDSIRELNMIFQK